MKKNVLFFWIPKGGGTSIYDVLKKYNCQKLTEQNKFTCFKNKGFVTFGHVSIPYLLKRKVIDKGYFEKSFKFCFVRNPWDRLVSLYHYGKYDKRMSFEEFVDLIYKTYKFQNSIFSKAVQIICNNSLFNYIGGVHKINFLLDRIPIKLLFYFPLLKIDPYNSCGLSSANPQVDWITQEGEIIVDFVGKLEDFNKDIKKVFKIIGIDQTNIKQLNKSNRRKNYRSYYSAKTNKIVGKIYKKDIDMFGYKF
jgi:hypothetical protein